MLKLFMRLGILGLALVLILFSDSRAGSTYVSTTGNYIPIELAQKTLIYTYRQYSISVSGDIMLCRQGISDDKCGRNNDGWIPMLKYDMPGYRLLGISFVGREDHLSLILFYGK